jgi:hypothetical protein
LCSFIVTICSILNRQIGCLSTKHDEKRRTETARAIDDAQQAIEIIIISSQLEARSEIANMRRQSDGH